MSQLCVGVETHANQARDHTLRVTALLRDALRQLVVRANWTATAKREELLMKDVILSVSSQNDEVVQLIVHFLTSRTAGFFLPCLANCRLPAPSANPSNVLPSCTVSSSL